MTQNKEKFQERVLTEAMLVDGIRDSILRFFQDKTQVCGGPIPKASLLSDKSINLVRRTSLDAAFTFMYRQLIPQLPVPDDYEDATLPWDVHYAIGIMRDAQRRWLPRPHIPGLMLLYFVFCKGLAVPYPVPEPVDSVIEYDTERS